MHHFLAQYLSQTKPDSYKSKINQLQLQCIACRLNESTHMMKVTKVQAFVLVIFLTNQIAAIPCDKRCDYSEDSSTATCKGESVFVLLVSPTILGDSSQFIL